MTQYYATKNIKEETIGYILCKREKGKKTYIPTNFHQRITEDQQENNEIDHLQMGEVGRTVEVIKRAVSLSVS